MAPPDLSRRHGTMITAKFGGTSLCDASHFQTVREILSRREDRRFVVVSAPGKRFGDDVKITDQLYRRHQEARQGGQVEATFAPVATRFRGNRGRAWPQPGPGGGIPGHPLGHGAGRGPGILRQPGRVLQRQNHGRPVGPALPGPGPVHLFSTKAANLTGKPPRIPWRRSSEGCPAR